MNKNHHHALRIDKPLSSFSLVLFALAFVPAASFLLGEFFFGNTTLLLSQIFLVIGINLLLLLLVLLIHSQETIMGEGILFLSDIFLLFPIRLYKKGLLNLIEKKPFRSGLGAAFTLSLCIIGVYSSYVYWPRITSKFSSFTNSQKFSKEEQAWQDYRLVRKMLKAYKKIKGNYPPKENWVMELKKTPSPVIQKNWHLLKIKKIGSAFHIIDPWGDPYIYFPYTSWKVLKTYRFYSIHMPMMK